MGLRKICTLGAFSRTSFRLSSWPAWLSTDMLVFVAEVCDALVSVASALCAILGA
jgi:hypothetical protein